MGGHALSLARAIPPLLLVGCLGPWTESEVDGLRVLERSGPVGAGGRNVHRVDVLPGETSLLLTAKAPSDVLAYVSRVTAPSGEQVFTASDWWESEFHRTNAAFSASVVNLAWPITEEDGPLDPGVWKVETRSDTVNIDLDVHVSLAADDDLDAGALVLDVIFADGLADDPDLRGGADAALAILTDTLYASHGIDVSHTVRAWDGPGAIDSPGFGDSELYLDAVGDKALRVVPVLFVRRIADGANVFGVAGGIPGPLVGSDRSTVTISLLEAAGRDGVLSAAQEELLSETLGHEIGHYLGLYHPVEIPPGGTGDIEQWDGLSDTPDCTTWSRCLNTLSDNMMFPTPVCAEGSLASCSAFVRQRQVSELQRGVLHRYAGVR